MAEILESISNFFDALLSYKIWGYNTFRLSVQGVIQVLFLFLGARIGIWALGRAFLGGVKGSNFDEGRRYTILQISKYLIYTVVIVMALETVGVKVTTLLAAETALFVGLGLGLQDAFKDLSSGVIILMERTLSVGDIIQLREQFGKVEAVGLRTTTLRTRDDILIIVPNSKLTNEVVINLTRSEETTRFSVEVGVAFGSDTQRVADLLRQVAIDHAELESRKEPLVILKDFGDSAIVFELNFYTQNLFHIEKIKSELRFAIDRAFRENKIIIPFPQRTVWQGTELVKQFGDGIEGDSENIASKNDDNTAGAL